MTGDKSTQSWDEFNAQGMAHDIVEDVMERIKESEDGEEFYYRDEVLMNAHLSTYGAGPCKRYRVTVSAEEL